MHRGSLKVSANLVILFSSGFTAEKPYVFPHTALLVKLLTGILSNEPFTFHPFVCLWTECKWCQFYYLLHKMFPSQGNVKGGKYGAVPQVPQGQLAISISRSQTPALLKSWGRFRWDVWKSSIHCLLTVHLRTLKCQVVAGGQVGFVSPPTDGWWDHLHWIIPLACEPFSKWWIQWELLPYICWTLL